MKVRLTQLARDTLTKNDITEAELIEIMEDTVPTVEDMVLGMFSVPQTDMSEIDLEDPRYTIYYCSRRNTDDSGLYVQIDLAKFDTLPVPPGFPAELQGFTMTMPRGASDEPEFDERS